MTHSSLFCGADAVVLTDAALRRYFSGFKSSFGILLLFRERTVLFTDNRYLEGAKEAFSGRAEVKLAVDFGGAAEELRRAGAKTVGYAAERTLVPEREEMERAGFALRDVSAEIAALMAVKGADEREKISRSCRIAEAAYRDVLGFLREGVTERDIAGELEYRFRRHGASDRSFESIVAFGENSAVPHHESGERRLKEGDVVLLDFGCVWGGYCSDMTRTLVFGAPDAAFCRAYAAVLGAHERAADRIRAGMTGRQADALARDYLAEREYGAYFTHSLGHGVGVNIHESPRLSASSDAVLAENNVFSIEPGVYLPGRFGIRVEDTYVLSGGRTKSFMSETKSLLCFKDGAWTTE